MPNSILRKDLFPFLCQNKECAVQFNEDAFIGIISRYGLVYADCENVIYQGINCPKCLKTSIIELPRGNPLVDLRGFIIAPSQNPLNDPFEQVLERERINDGYDYLKFKSIPAWDEEMVSYPEILAWYHATYSDHQSGSINSYWIPPIQVKMSLNIENNSRKAEFRRLYLDIPKFRHLLTCLSPNRITEVISDVGLNSKSQSLQEWHERNIAWSGMVEEALNKPLKDAVEEAVKYQISSKVDMSQIDDLIEKHRHELWFSQSSPKEYLREQASHIGFEDKIFKWEGWKILFDEFFSHVGTEVALSYHRNRLSSWVDKAKEGRALFVDAPMGIGKSYSVVETLATNPDLSAVIFMPTNSLCEDILDQLKIRISEVRGHNYYEQYEKRNGISRIRLNYLHEEIYFADGINMDCLHYKDIIKRYRRYWLKKRGHLPTV